VAAATGKPLLAVLAAGDRDGLCGYGGDALRSGALADRRVIELVNAEFVPVWINVRTTALPRLPFVAEVLVGAKTILNPQPSILSASISSALRDGTQCYAAVDAADYLSLLGKALKRYRGEL
jgi:hypothetical protein